MKHKSMKVMTLATVLALSMSASALAVTPAPGGGGGTPPSDAEVAANADTTISIFQTAATQANISYTVPLYVTMAVVNNTAAVQAPTNYILTNTTALPQGETTADKQPKIAVTNMSFEKLNTGANGFNTVAEADVGTEPKNIFLKIGGAQMPALNTEGIKPVPLHGSVFVDASDKPIGLQGAKNLGIEAKVAPVARTDAATAAQFRVKYTVSLLDASGQALGSIYAGDDRTQAGLEAWPNPTH